MFAAIETGQVYTLQKGLAEIYFSSLHIANAFFIMLIFL